MSQVSDIGSIGTPVADRSADAPPQPRRRPGRPRKADAPPRTPPRAAAEPPKRAPGRPPSRVPLRTQLEDFYGGTGLMAALWSPYVGGVVLDCAPRCAAAIDAACQQSPAVRVMVERVLQTSVMGQVLGAHVPIAVALATRLRAGEPDPSTLSEAGPAAAGAGGPSPQPAPGATPAGFGGFGGGAPSDADLGEMLGRLNEMGAQLNITPQPNGSGAPA